MDSRRWTGKAISIRVRYLNEQGRNDEGPGLLLQYAFITVPADGILRDGFQIRFQVRGFGASSALQLAPTLNDGHSVDCPFIDTVYLHVFRIESYCAQVGLTLAVASPGPRLSPPANVPRFDPGHSVSPPKCLSIIPCNWTPRIHNPGLQCRDTEGIRTLHSRSPPASHCLSAFRLPNTPPHALSEFSIKATFCKNNVS